MVMEYKIKRVGQGEELEHALFGLGKKKSSSSSSSSSSGSGQQGAKKGSTWSNHLYIARQKAGDKWRYFYSQAELNAAKAKGAAKSAVAKVKRSASDIKGYASKVNTDRSRYQEAAKKERSQATSAARRNVDDENAYKFYSGAAYASYGTKDYDKYKNIADTEYDYMHKSESAKDRHYRNADRFESSLNDYNKNVNKIKYGASIALNAAEKAINKGKTAASKLLSSAKSITTDAVKNGKKSVTDLLNYSKNVDKRAEAYDEASTKAANQKKYDTAEKLQNKANEAEEEKSSAKYKISRAVSDTKEKVAESKAAVSKFLNDTSTKAKKLGKDAWSEIDYQAWRAGNAVKDKAKDIADDIGWAVYDAKEGIKGAAGNVREAIEDPAKAKDHIKSVLSGDYKKKVDQDLERTKEDLEQREARAKRLKDKEYENDKKESDAWYRQMNAFYKLDDLKKEYDAELKKYKSGNTSSIERLGQLEQEIKDTQKIHDDSLAEKDEYFNKGFDLTDQIWKNDSRIRDEKLATGAEGLYYTKSPRNAQNHLDYKISDLAGKGKTLINSGKSAISKFLSDESAKAKEAWNGSIAKKAIDEGKAAVDKFGKVLSGTKGANTNKAPQKENNSTDKEIFIPENIIYEDRIYEDRIEDPQQLKSSKHSKGNEAASPKNNRQYNGTSTKADNPYTYNKHIGDPEYWKNLAKKVPQFTDEWWKIQENITNAYLDRQNKNFVSERIDTR